MTALKEANWIIDWLNNKTDVDWWTNDTNRIMPFDFVGLENIPLGEIVYFLRSA